MQASARLQRATGGMSRCRASITDIHIILTLNVTAGVSPPAEGDGRYEPLPGVGAVVAVVGTAHVRGIIRAWGEALRDQAVAQYVD
jgi:hypothetical protein